MDANAKVFRRLLKCFLQAFRAWQVMIRGLQLWNGLQSSKCIGDRNGQKKREINIAYWNRSTGTYDGTAIGWMVTVL